MSSSHSIEATFCFVDLAGFTALTEAHGDEDAARLATRFARLSRAALAPEDRLVKSMGDAVLLTSPSPAAALDLVQRILAHAAEEQGFPALRAGMHHGVAVVRGGDVFGAAVNLAARVANEAYAGEVLGTAPIDAAARELGIPTVDLGAVILKNVREPIPLFSVAILVGASDEIVDPVCRVPLDRHTAVGRLRHKATEYWFCSLACAAAFASNPSWHIGDGAR